MIRAQDKQRCTSDTIVHCVPAVTASGSAGFKGTASQETKHWYGTARLQVGISTVSSTSLAPLWAAAQPVMVYLESYRKVLHHSTFTLGLCLHPLPLNI